MSSEDQFSLNLYMDGPYSLNSDEIKNLVKEKSIGNFALGQMDNQGKFVVTFVGRSDKDLQDTILQYVFSDKFQCFKFSYAENPKQAFEKECMNFHDFGEDIKLLNTEHPQPPKDKFCECPYCDIFDFHPQVKKNEKKKVSNYIKEWIGIRK